MTLIFGQPYIYTLPTSEDPEGLPYNTTMESGPSYASLISNDTQIKLEPKNCTADFGVRYVKIRLYDEQPANKTY